MTGETKAGHIIHTTTTALDAVSAPQAKILQVPSAPMKRKTEIWRLDQMHTEADPGQGRSKHLWSVTVATELK